MQHMESFQLSEIMEEKKTKYLIWCKSKEEKWVMWPTKLQISFL